MGTMKPAGRIWAFGDNISTEYMMPGHVMLSKMSEEEAKLRWSQKIGQGAKVYSTG